MYFVFLYSTIKSEWSEKTVKTVVFFQEENRARHAAYKISKDLKLDTEQHWQRFFEIQYFEPETEQVVAKMYPLLDGGGIIYTNINSRSHRDNVYSLFVGTLPDEEQDIMLKFLYATPL